MLDHQVYARTRIKICGLTRADDVHAAVRAGADAIGLVFYPPSKRSMDLSRARTLRELAPAFVDVVALFVNPDRQYVQQVIDTVNPDLLQFHGEESPAFCASFGVRYMKGFRVGAPSLDSASGLARYCAAYAQASAWLFDSYSGGYGGSGTSFEQSLLAEVRASEHARPIVLAGGLSVANVPGSLSAVHPFAVDVSSGVEDAPGIKNPEKIRAFVQAVANADKAMSAH
ncbi:phosphoribosylanthranilate isomerase [Alcaligenaceae bacterium CGII-47]|nr:phosphoribosylanthranilate isomerase [Alcaligenaceae bacterium CGII-47]